MSLVHIEDGSELMGHTEGQPEPRILMISRMALINEYYTGTIAIAKDHVRPMRYTRSIGRWQKGWRKSSSAEAYP